MSIIAASVHQPGRRRIERMCRDSKQWTRVTMAQLDRGDVFRMFEPDGHPVADSTGRTEYLALSDAREIDGVWGIEVES